MSQEKTNLFNVKDIDLELVKKTITEVSDALEERGYNSTNQLVGYLISGDPGYISSYKGAREKIQEVDRAKIVEILIDEFRRGTK